MVEEIFKVLSFLQSEWYLSSRRGVYKPITVLFFFKEMFKIFGKDYYEMLPILYSLLTMSCLMIYMNVFSCFSQRALSTIDCKVAPM